MDYLYGAVNVGHALKNQRKLTPGGVEAAILAL